MNFFHEAKALHDELLTIRRHLHKFPELSHKEYETTQFITDQLTEYGIDEFSPLPDTGVIAIIRGSKPGKTVAIRADIDALPITEETGLPYASVNDGVMHACGHDVHTTVALGCAKLLQAKKHDLQGTVKCIFQPAEEMLQGSRYILDAGGLDQPPVDAIMALHCWPDIPVGTIGVRHGSMMASSDTFTIRVYGQQGHAAHPHKCVDPIVISGQIVNTLQTVVSREIPPTDPLVLTVGKIQGGKAYNIIPSMVEMIGTVRSLNPDLRSEMPGIMRRIVEGTAAAMRGRAEVDYQFGTPPLISDEGLNQIVEATTQELLGDDKLVHLTIPSMGSEDFAFYMERVRGVFFRLGIYSDQLEARVPLHSPSFMVDEACLPIGVAVMSQAVYTYLMEPST
ncbi:amidohydrolase [candidate division KSB3 bacterium]|uniref:Amidohydrolase n=1 Tax=candidate division KSB3 bacterium TaxID=2044937 RepID=A0A9D5Q4N5_9BACT|nr:amidohydrolase [candidate division KSB3 bacterium]MBD3323101.1 amidohydrolase [candidate division KSB3 bacterium]